MKKLPYECPKHPGAVIEHTWEDTVKKIITGIDRMEHIKAFTRNHKFCCYICRRRLAEIENEIDRREKEVRKKFAPHWWANSI